METEETDAIKLRRIIDQSGYNIYEWAEELKVNRRTIYLWLNNTHTLSGSRWHQINSAFGKVPKSLRDNDIIETYIDYKKRYFIELHENDRLKDRLRELQHTITDLQLQLNSYKKSVPK